MKAANHFQKLYIHSLNISFPLKMLNVLSLSGHLPIGVAHFLSCIKCLHATHTSPIISRFSFFKVESALLLDVCFFSIIYGYLRH